MSLVMTDYEQAVEVFSQPKIPVSASNSLLDDELMFLNSNASICIRRKTELIVWGGYGGRRWEWRHGEEWEFLFSYFIYFSARPAAPYITI